MRHITGYSWFCVSIVPPAGLGKGMSAPIKVREGDECPWQG